MLSLDAPHIVQQMREFLGGLCPIEFDGKACLAIKGSKERLLAAKVNGGFKIYVAPLPLPDGVTIGLITAFFDDHDEPLTITTPMFGGDPFCDSMISLLFENELDIYFFDEHAREWMSYRCDILDGGSLLAGAEPIDLLAPDLQLGLAMVGAIDAWFSLRNADDDARAISVTFREELWPSDIAIMDLRDGVNDYIGTSNASVAILTREHNIGYFQERDIVAGFKRVFAADQIVLNPFQRTTKKEFADVVVGADDALIIVQAKDSPNSEASMGRTIKRKILKSGSQVDDALGQSLGALDYAHQAEPIPLWIKGEDIDLFVNGREIISIVVITETFPTQGPSFVTAMREWRARGDFLVIMDYPGFHAFTFYYESESLLVAGLRSYVSAQLDSGIWIKPQAYAVDAFLKRHPEFARPTEEP